MFVPRVAATSGRAGQASSTWPCSELTPSTIAASTTWPCTGALALEQRGEHAHGQEQRAAAEVADEVQRRGGARSVAADQVRARR